jgi:hypothetical protein
MPKVRTVCVQRLPASISSSNSRLVAASSMPVGYALTATGFGVPPGSRSVPRRTTPNAPLAQQPARRLVHLQQVRRELALLCVPNG